MMRDNAVQAKPALVKTIEQRLLSKQGMDLPEALAALVDKIARRSFQMTEHDFAAALAAGFTEDQLFEVVIRAAVGESSWLYRAGWLRWRRHPADAPRHSQRWLPVPNQAAIQRRPVVQPQPLPDAAKLTFYRPDFYGSYSKALTTHEAMRGPSAWRVAERELMAAYVSRVNDCPFCIGAHTATATHAFGNEMTVNAALADLESAPISEGLRATLQMLGKLTRDGDLSGDDVRAVLQTGVSREQVEDAFAI